MSNSVKKITQTNQHMLTQITCENLASRLFELPKDAIINIYAAAAPDLGENYGVMVTYAFDTRLYVLCSIRDTHCKAISCDDGMHALLEKGLIQQMLQEAWAEAGLSDFYINEEQWQSLPPKKVDTCRG